jgi:hypothetical protein
MLNGSEATSRVADTAPPDPTFATISFARKAIAADMKSHSARTWADVERAMENLVNTEPSTPGGLRALTSFLRQFSPLVALLKADGNTWLHALLVTLDLAAQRLA